MGTNRVAILLRIVTELCRVQAAALLKHRRVLKESLCGQMLQPKKNK